MIQTPPHAEPYHLWGEVFSLTRARVTIGRQDPHDRTFDAFAQSIGRERTIVRQWHAWVVRECVDPVTFQRTLVFSGDGVARRVRSFPPQWRELSDDALYDLSWSR